MTQQPKPSAATDEQPASTDSTPGSDMQPEDTGTADSGNEATPAEKAMKQTSKTPQEQGAGD